MDIFNLDRGVIDQHAYGQSQRGQSHDMDIMANQIQHRHRGHDRERYGGDYDQSAAPRSQEDDGHYPDQHRGNEDLLENIDQGISNESRLIKCQPDSSSLGRERLDAWYYRLCLIDDRQCRSRADFQDG